MYKIYVKVSMHLSKIRERTHAFFSPVHFTPSNITIQQQTFIQPRPLYLNKCTRTFLQFMTGLGLNTDTNYYYILLSTTLALISALIWHCLILKGLTLVEETPFSCFRGMEYLRFQRIIELRTWMQLRRITLKSNVKRKCKKVHAADWERDQIAEEYVLESRQREKK